MEDRYENGVRLIYLDPPFRTGESFKMRIGKGKQAQTVVLYEDTERLYHRLNALGYEADLVRVTGAEHEGSFWSEAVLEIIFAFIQEKIG